MDLQPLVDHRHCIGSHLAGAGRVIDSLRNVAGTVQQLIVGLHAGPRQMLTDDEGL